MGPDQGEQESRKGVQLRTGRGAGAKRKNGMLVKLGGEASVAPPVSPATVVQACNFSQEPECWTVSR